MRTTDTGTHEQRHLAWALRLIGAGWAAYFAFILANELLGLFSHDSLVGHLVMWGHGGRAYLVMLSIINIVLGIYLVVSARDPYGNRMFIDFALFASSAHITAMLIMSLTEPGEHEKLTGDVGAGILLMVAFAWFWLPARRVVAAPNVIAP